MSADLHRIAGRIARILDTLNDTPITVRKLAAEVDMPRSTAQDYLTALEANGRAERTLRGWTQPSVTFLFDGCPADADGSENRGVRWAA